MALRIDGKIVSGQIKDELKEKVAAYKKTGGRDYFGSDSGW